ncbi:MAG: NHL repeat-containing protein [Polyangiaceae bacterium]|nr:NHL repeat-containing protein [Polyangiaceae bacterium]
MRRIQGTVLFAFVAMGCTGEDVQLTSPASVRNVVSTLAGTGAAGTLDGLSTVATFDHPYAVALGPDGSLYVADTYNNKIRKIATDGTVATYAGTGAASLMDSDCAHATFNYPTSIAVDSAGNVYVADRANQAIRKITAIPCQVSTLAGPVTDVDSGNTTSPFNGPTGLTVDASGNVYVTDFTNNTILKVTSTGTVIPIAGNGSAGNANGTTSIATFNSPVGIAVDGAGNLYVADLKNNDVRKITSDSVSTLAGSGAQGPLTDGTGDLAAFNGPYGLAIGADNNLYVADRGNNAIRKVSPAGEVTTLAGTGTPGADDDPADTATFNQPTGVAVDDAGILYIADTANNKVRKITLAP